MPILVLCVVVVICLAIVFVGLDHMPVIGEPWKSILKALACVIGVYVLLTRSGLL